MRKLILLPVFLLFLLNIYSQENDNQDTEETMTYEEAKMKHESENPVFMQKGGTMRKGEHGFYLRTNDEWTGFSTIFLGYRYSPVKIFDIGIEGGVSAIPHVYIAAIMLNLQIFESKNKIVFVGLRLRTGYRYQDSDFSGEFWEAVVGKNYLTLKRNGIYIAPDLTIAFRMGKYKQFAVYHTIYPRIDIDFVDKENPVYVLFSPIMAGFEVRFPRKKKMRWSFAFEAGYTFPIPWGYPPQGKWVNFPSLANISFNYRFGDKFYSKENRAKYK